MATDVYALETANQELAQAVANMQRAVDQMQQQLSLLELAALNTIRGQWDAARFGSQSAEAALVARNPGLQGKVHGGQRGYRDRALPRLGDGCPELSARLKKASFK